VNKLVLTVHKQFSCVAVLCRYIKD